MLILKLATKIFKLPIKISISNLKTEFQQSGLRFNQSTSPVSNFVKLCKSQVTHLNFLFSIYVAVSSFHST